nr:hypothetical protein CFP56_62132 [Quercus suber]
MPKKHLASATLYNSSKTSNSWSKSQTLCYRSASKSMPIVSNPTLKVAVVALPPLMSTWVLNGSLPRTPPPGLDCAALPAIAVLEDVTTELVESNAVVLVLVLVLAMTMMVLEETAEELVNDDERPRPLVGQVRGDDVRAFDALVPARGLDRVGHLLQPVDALFTADGTVREIAALAPGHHRRVDRIARRRQVLKPWEEIGQADGGRDVGERQQRQRRWSAAHFVYCVVWYCFESRSKIPDSLRSLPEIEYTAPF